MRTLKMIIMILGTIAIMSGCNVSERKVDSSREIETFEKKETKKEYFSDFQEYDFTDIENFWSFSSMPAGVYQISEKIYVIISEEDIGWIEYGDYSSDPLKHPILTKDGLYGTDLYRQIKLETFETTKYGEFKCRIFSLADVKEKGFSEIDYLEDMTFGYIGTEYSLYSKGKKLASIDVGEKLDFEVYPSDYGNVRGIETGNIYKFLVAMSNNSLEMKLVKIAESTDYAEGIYVYGEGNIKLYSKNGRNYMVVPQNEENLKFEGFRGITSKIPEGKSLDDFSKYESIEVSPENMTSINFIYGGDNYTFRLLYHYQIGKIDMKMDVIADKIEKQYLSAVIPDEELEKWTTNEFEPEKLAEKENKLNQFLENWENENEEYILHFLSNSENEWIKNISGAEEFLEKH